MCFHCMEVNGLLFALFFLLLFFSGVGHAMAVGTIRSLLLLDTYYILWIGFWAAPLLYLCALFIQKSSVKCTQFMYTIHFEACNVFETTPATFSIDKNITLNCYCVTLFHLQIVEAHFAFSMVGALWLSLFIFICIWGYRGVIFLATNEKLSTSTDSQNSHKIVWTSSQMPNINMKNADSANLKTDAKDFTATFYLWLIGHPAKQQQHRYIWMKCLICGACVEIRPITTHLVSGALTTVAGHTDWTHFISQLSSFGFHGTP